MKKGKGKYILENVKIGENLYSICGDKYFYKKMTLSLYLRMSLTIKSN